MTIQNYMHGVVKSERNTVESVLNIPSTNHELFSNTHKFPPSIFHSHLALPSMHLLIAWSLTTSLRGTRRTGLTVLQTQ